MAIEKTFDAQEAEARITQAWETSGAFAAGANASRPETFSIVIPPPNVTGSLHMGHAFNNTLQDILTRWHRMRGFDTLWQPGTDHAGIATQMVVERELAQTNRRRTDMSREEFVGLVWEQKKKSRGNIIGQLKRLGASCDWSREAFTMSGAPGAPEGEAGNFHDAVIKVFVDMYNKGLIYRGKRLVNWDPHFETAISDLEVENIETPGQMWHFKYPLAGGETYEYLEQDEDGQVTLCEERDYISIATTRPETMLGDGAVAVHPSDVRYASIVGKLCEIPVGPKEHRRLIPIITDDYPDPNFGSGAVKITGAHDFNDYGVAMRNRIPMYRLMDTAGRMRDDGAVYAEAAAEAQKHAQGWVTLFQGQEARVGSMGEHKAPDVDHLNLVPDDLRGLDRFEARKKVVEQITGEGLAVMVENDQGETLALVDKKPIMQPFGDRSKVVIEPMLTDQWFVDTDKIVGPAIEAVKTNETRILPEQDRKVYFNWLENIEPWCISRQLWWGHQIPVWYDNLGNEFCAPNAWEAAKKAISFHRNRLPDAELMFTVLADPNQFDDLDRSKLDELGFYDFDAKTKVDFDPRGVGEALSPDTSGRIVARPFGDRRDATQFYGCQLERDPDVLDTWYSSGLWPIGTLGWPEETDELKKYFPTSVLVTGFDIIFFWVARMMMMQYAVVGEKPFKDVYVHALVRDEKGKKMSKSLGNVLDPLELIDEFGADAVRFTLTSMAAMGRDLKLSVQRIAGYRNFGTKLWNAARFAEMNEAIGGSKEPPQATATVNRWIIGETAKARVAVDEALENYRFNDAANGLYAFVWGVVCDWYVEFSKPLLMDGDNATKAETQATMAWVIDQCLVLLHPIMPFVTEELWGTLAERQKMLVHADWPDYGTELVDADADAEMSWVIGLIDAVRSARAQVHVPVGLRVPLVVRAMTPAAQAAWDSNATMIQRLARIEALTETDAHPKGCITLGVEGGDFAIPVADVIDVGEEKARLEKTLGKLEKELGGLRGRLKNPKFVESAPEDVVEETRENLAQREAEESKLREALSRLSELA
ncbi:MAG: valine--tRNA ligase [Pseudomonadota bacterium]